MASLEPVFAAFSKFGDSKSNGTMISLNQSDKWMNQAKVIDGKTITSNDTGITFNKLFKGAKTISYNDYRTFVDDLAKQKGLKTDDLIHKLLRCGAPDSTNTTDAFEPAFAAFSKFGDSKSNGTMISLTQSDKWMKQAKVIDGKKITTTDTGITFNKLFKGAKTISYNDYRTFVDDLAKQKGLKTDDLIHKLLNCGAPGTTGATQAVKVGGVDRLTDTSQYTGSHKERFDESGKGKGMAGREDLHENDGYVGGYKEKGTYDRKISDSKSKS